MSSVDQTKTALMRIKLALHELPVIREAHRIISTRKGRDSAFLVDVLAFEGSFHLLDDACPFLRCLEIIN